MREVAACEYVFGCRARGRDARESCLGEPMVPLNRMCFLDQCFLDQVQEAAERGKA